VKASNVEIDNDYIRMYKQPERIAVDFGRTTGDPDRIPIKQAFNYGGDDSVDPHNNRKGWHLNWVYGSPTTEEQVMMVLRRNGARTNCGKWNIQEYWNGTNSSVAVLSHQEARPRLA